MWWVLKAGFRRTDQKPTSGKKHKTPSLTLKMWLPEAMASVAGFTDIRGYMKFNIKLATLVAPFAHTAAGWYSSPAVEW